MVQQRKLPDDLTSPRNSALEKALAVVEALTEQPQGVGLPDLAARLNLARQTVHRILGQLEATGLVVRDPSRERYSVGPRLSRLALASLRSHNQTAPIRLILQELVDEIGETCNVGVLDDLDYVYLHRIECHWPLRMHLEAGSRLGAHVVSGGKMLLSQLDPDSCRRLIRVHKLEPATKKTITRPADLEADLAKVRARGFALNNEEFIDGIIGVAVPINDSSGRALAALAMHGPVTRLTLKACEAQVPRLMRTAERLAKVWLAD
jgi:IclR family acetate operon transcriptional repressor